MSGAGTRRREAANRLRRRISGLLRGGEPGAFGGVENFCMFIGYPRSGHDLVSSLLDAHPNAVIAHELDALERVRERIARQKLYKLLVDNSRAAFSRTLSPSAPPRRSPRRSRGRGG